MPLSLLDEKVRSRLRSGVAITTMAQCVRELVENAIDAGAKCIAVRVDISKYKLQVIDNGGGVTRKDLDLIGQRYATSKCHTIADLDHSLQHLGYRGEALASTIDCSGTVEIQSRHRLTQETYSKIFLHGESMPITLSSNQRPSVGTTVSVHDFFYNLPVRRRLITADLELENIRQNLLSIALVYPSISFSLRNNLINECVLQTRKTNSVLASFSVLFGSSKASNMKEISFEHSVFNITGYMSTESHHSKNLQFVYVNGRHVKKTALHSCVNSLLANSLIAHSLSRQADSRWRGVEPDIANPKRVSEKQGMYVLMVKCHRSEYDVCLEPEKTLIEFKDWDMVLDCLTQVVRQFLGRYSLTLGPGCMEGEEGAAKSSPSKEHSGSEGATSGGDGNACPDVVSTPCGSDRGVDVEQPDSCDRVAETSAQKQSPVLERALGAASVDRRRDFQSNAEDLGTVKTGPAVLRLDRPPARSPFNCAGSKLAGFLRSEKAKLSVSCSAVSASREVVSHNTLPAIVGYGQKSQDVHVLRPGVCDTLPKQPRPYALQNTQPVRTDCEQERPDPCEQPRPFNTQPLRMGFGKQPRHALQDTMPAINRFGQQRLDPCDSISASKQPRPLPDTQEVSMSCDTVPASMDFEREAADPNGIVPVMNWEEWRPDLQTVPVNTGCELGRSDLDGAAPVSTGCEQGRSDLDGAAPVNTVCEQRRSETHGTVPISIPISMDWKLAKKNCDVNVLFPSRTSSHKIDQLELNVFSDRETLFPDPHAPSTAATLPILLPHNSESIQSSSLQSFHPHHALEFDPPICTDIEILPTPTDDIGWSHAASCLDAHVQSLTRNLSPACFECLRSTNHVPLAWELQNKVTVGDSAVLLAVDEYCETGGNIVTGGNSVTSVGDGATLLAVDRECCEAGGNIVAGGNSVTSVGDGATLLAVDRECCESGGNSVTSVGDKCCETGCNNVASVGDGATPLAVDSCETGGNSVTNVPQTIWKEVFDPITAKKVYIHSKTGNCCTSIPRSRPNSGISRLEEAGSSRDAEGGQLQDDGGGLSPCYGAKPIRAAPHLSHDFHCFLPGAKRLKIDNIPASTGQSVDFDHSDGSNETWGDSVTSQDSGPFESLLKSWKNPIFLPGQEDILGTGVSRRSQIRVHNIINHYKFSREMLDNIQVLGQVDQKFIACILDTKGTGQHNLLVCFDQHAAHERVRLEALYADLYETQIGAGSLQLSVKSSTVHPPLLINLSVAEKKLAKTFRKQLELLGVTLVQQSGSVGVASLPSVMMERDMSEVKRGRPAVALDMVQDMIVKHLEVLLATSGGSSTIPPSLTNVLNSQACHSAIKFGDPLTTEECSELIQSLSKCKLPFQCAHGRPSLVPLLDVEILKKKYQQVPQTSISELCKKLSAKLKEL